MEEMGQRRGWERDAELGGGGYLFSGHHLHLSRPRGSSEDPLCALWAVWVTLITGTVTDGNDLRSLGPVGLMVSSLSPSVCSLYPPPMNPQACPPPRFSQRPPREVDTRHWMLSCIRKSLGPWGRREREGGWVGEKEAGLSHSEASGKWRGGLINTLGITQHRML